MAKPLTVLPDLRAKHLGARIRVLRLNMGLDQQRFARLIGTSQQALSSWEAGVHLRKLETGMRIERMLREANL